MRILAAFFVILLLFPLSSCAASSTPDCREILTAMTDAEIGLPAGKTYSLRAKKGDDEYLSEHLLNSLYGDGERPVMADGWIDIAIFLSLSDHPCEFAVFLCDSKDTATDTARMLCHHIDVIRTANEGLQFSHYLDNATVTIIKNYVLMIISSDSENILKVASKIIG